MDSVAIESVAASPIVTRKPSAPPKKEIWSVLLKSVASGKRLAEKQLLVLGATPESQRDFITSLDTDPNPRPTNRTQHSSKPPIANDFALGYTYQDVLDTDHEDILARLSIYTLAKPSARFLPLLRPLFTPTNIPNMLLVILLDWSEPWNWIRQLRAWIRLLHSLLQSLPVEAVQALQENITEWRDRKRNAAKDTSTSTSDPSQSSLDADISLPLGPGEWDLPLGVPLCVVCQNANKIDSLERESGWKDRHFDFVQQYLRTVLLKHGGSLIYTMPHLSGSAGGTTIVLRTLVHISLGIQSLLQQSSGTLQSSQRMMATLKHNTTDRDHILVPPNFDSWGKIRILTEDFNVEEVSEAWAQDIGAPGDDEAEEDLTTGESPSKQKAPEKESFAVLLFKEVIKTPEEKANAMALPNIKSTKTGLEVESKDIQGFLGEQAGVLDELGKEDERTQTLRDTRKNLGPLGAGDVEEHIGPVQFNLGGIQMDAEDVVKRLKDREATRAAEAENTATGTSETTQPPESEEAENAKLANFFTSLIKKPGGSASNSPRRARGDATS